MAAWAGSTNIRRPVIEVMHHDAQPGTTYVCRPSASDETPNAKMTAATSTSGLRTIGQTNREALTPQQINDAYVRFIEQTFHIDHTS
jgi:hypothetical protein